MAWNPNIPTITNRVQDDLDAIRENFQHLDPLAQAVGELQAVSGLAPVANELQAVSGLAPVANELQAVSGLAPVANELQAVSGLAPVANELQAVSGLAPVANELQAVSGLAPYIQAILGGRIVDHNLDVPTSPNGRYVRWENGLQVCFVRSVGAGPSPVDWVLPAAFVDGSYAVVGTSLDWPFLVVTVDWQYTTANNVRFRKWNHDGTEFTGTLRAISAFAIGRWK